MAFLKEQKYGKDKVRVVKVIKRDHAQPFATQDVYEMTLCVLLEGDFELSYTQADNSMVVPTDTVKNTIYYLTKKSKHVDVPELFCKEIAGHFLRTYPHVSAVHVDLLSHNWTRVCTSALTPVNEEGSTGTSVSSYQNWSANFQHPHSYSRQGEDKRVVKLVAKRQDANKASMTIQSGIQDLHVLKTTGSYFVQFHRDSYTTLPDMTDRLFSTKVLSKWVYPTETVNFTSTDSLLPKSLSSCPSYNAIYDGTKQIFIDFFANHNSPSVQNTLYLAGKFTLQTFPDIQEIYYALPNIHVFPYELSKLGVQNSGQETDTYYPVSDPSGLITATIKRDSNMRSSRL